MCVVKLTGEPQAWTHSILPMSLVLNPGHGRRGVELRSRSFCSRRNHRTNSATARSRRRSHAPPGSIGSNGSGGSHRRCRPNSSAFFEAPGGVEFLRRLLLALHLVFGQSQDAGLRSLAWFLELTGLDQFVGGSFGSQQKLAAEIETLLGQFGDEEDRRLGQQMSPKSITLCEDETFHPQICLVAIEPVSNFLVVEQYAAQRDAATWTAAVQQAIAPFHVTVIQCTTDEAKALRAHAENELGAHHSPDIFHVQQDTSRATSLSLAKQTQQAQERLATAEQQQKQQSAEAAACREQCPTTEQLAELERVVGTSEQQSAEARQHLATCQDRERQAAEARRGLSRDYHPFDLTDGQPVEEAEVERRLTGHFDTLRRVAEEAKLSEPARKKIAKARRVLPSLVATLLFYWRIVTARIAELQLTPDVERAFREELLAGHYLARVADRCEVAAERQRLRELSTHLLTRARSPTSVLAGLPESERQRLELAAIDGADVFQRSSSCVEGRNGQLSLRHHGLHRLTPRKLKALRVLHNYVVHRADGTTAAERFFGQRPRDVFAWLLERITLPGRPRHRRRCSRSSPCQHR